MAEWKCIKYNCSPFFLKKKHLCINCKGKLTIKSDEVVVDSHSAEAKEYDFFLVDTYMDGPVKFITYYFECPMCGKIYDIDTLKRIEKRKRR